MKPFLIIIFLFSSFIVSSQSGGDVIFWLDNSGSIDDNEWIDMKNSVTQLIEGVLGCNENNRIAVVHYAANVDNNISPTLFIESDFTSNQSVALNFDRRGGVSGPYSALMGYDDFAHESLELIGNALDNTASSGIISSQTTLSHDSTKELIIFLFTDAFRSSQMSSGFNFSSIVSVSNFQIGSPLAFQNYTDFKSNRGAKFIITLIPDDSNAISACAAVASPGGNYTGAIESFPTDVDGPGSLPRKLLVTNFFSVSSEDLSNLIQSICSEIPNSYVGNQYIEIPNIVSLSSEEGNNSFFVKHSGIETFECQILNRWGNVIYHYNDPNGSWIGKTDAGVTVDDGVYYYKINVTWQGGKSEQFHGFITLVN